MEFKGFLSFLLLVSVAGIYGSAVNQLFRPSYSGLFRGAVSPKETPCNADYGAAFQRLFCGLASSLPGSLPDPLVLGDIPIHNLTAIAPELKGTMDLWGVSISGLPSVAISSCSVLTPTPESPLLFDLGAVDVGHIELRATYKLDALIASIIPLYGEGDLFVAMELSATVDTDIAICPYESPMEMIRFDYTLALKSPINIEIDGLLDGAEFVQEIIKKLEEPSTFASLEKLIHANVTQLLPTIANPILTNFTGCTFLGC